MKKYLRIGLAVIAAGLLMAATQITIFVIPPIGAVPEGRTVIITRLDKTQFIDSPDAMCERIQGGVSLLCRGMVIGGVLGKSSILARLPYSEWLYGISTSGKSYSN